MDANVVSCRVAAGPLDCEVSVPGSKSIANRALVCAALAGNDTTLFGVPDGDDAQALIESLCRLGVIMSDEDAGTGGRTLRFVTAVGLDATDTVRLDARLAGTTSRFLTALCALREGTAVIDGFESLRRRPMADLHDALRGLGAQVVSMESPGHLPVEVSRSVLRGGEVEIDGSTSSQFTTALLLIAPYLRGGLRVIVTGPRVSDSYLLMTTRVMAEFGADVVTSETLRGLEILVGEGTYVPCAYRVEADASSASYPLAMAAVCGGAVTVPGLSADSLQGDVGFARILEQMGCDVDWGPDSVTVRRHLEHPLRGIDVDLVDMSDLVPSVAVVALFAAETSRIRGVGFIRHKESDRLGDLAAELEKCGARIAVMDDGLVIDPAPMHGSRLATHHDHRLAMAFAVLGARLPGIEIEDPDVVTKSWPGYWATRESILATLD
jgi:3-phosphoshikimate 1-carboxyvinyltransferase